MLVNTYPCKYICGCAARTIVNPIKTVFTLSVIINANCVRRTCEKSKTKLEIEKVNWLSFYARIETLINSRQ